MAAFHKLVLLQKRILILTILRRRVKKYKRDDKYRKRMWVRDLFKQREEKGEYNILIRDMRLFDSEFFFRCFRMSPTTFEELLSWIAPFIIKSSVRRATASPAERLCVTLRYLATGDAQFTIASSYRISPTTVGRIIRETCQVLWCVLTKKGYMAVPKTTNDWRIISSEFERKWNFNHCLGAIDGKHIIIQAPARSGSLYYNYKKCHSIVLLAVCNARYEFTLVDVGDAGRQSDSGIYNNSKLGHAIDNNLLNFPPAEPISGYDQTKQFPFPFIGDEAFALKPYMMRPYARGNGLGTREAIFSYRLSRARRIIENSFGVLASRFRIFRRPIIADVENVKFITKATLSLHNFLMKRQYQDNYRYCPRDFVDRENSSVRQAGQWRSDINDVHGLVPIQFQGSHNYSRSAKITRDDFKDFFNSEVGALSWQEDHVNSTTDPFDEQ